MVKVLPAPESLVDLAGAVRYGVFDGPLRSINLDDARLTWRGLRLPRALVRFRLKEWQHLALVLPDAFVGFAIVDAKFLRTTWCHVLDRRTGEHFEHKRESPLLDMRLARELWDDRSHVRARGYAIELECALERGEHRLRIDIEAKGALGAVEAELRCPHELGAIEPMVVSLPVGPNRAMYSHKVPLPLEGTLRLGGREVSVDPARCFAILDVHKAHYPRETWWNWATCVGHDAAGRAVGLNLTRNVCLDDTTLNENGVWIDGRLHHLGPALFELDRADPGRPWKIGTRDGQVDLIFTPQGSRSDEVRLGIVRSAFRQPYGTFSGTVEAGGERLELKELFGVCEDHDTLW